MTPEASIPRRRTDLVVSDVEEGRETVFLDTATETVVSLNTTATAIWYLCDGKRTLGDIVEEVAAVRTDVDRARLEEDVRAAVALLRQHRLLNV